MRLALSLLILLLFPGTAAAADLSLTLEPEDGVQYGTPHAVTGTLTEGGTPLAGRTVELQRRIYPYDGGFRRVASTVTRADGTFAFKRRFDRNAQLRAVAGDARSPTRRAYVFPRPRSKFKGLTRNRLRITQFLRVPRGVKLTAKTIFYLGPGKAKSAPPVARAKPKRIGRGRFRARATVKLPRRWGGAFRYGSCFRYSEGSGMGDPGARCPKRYRF